jgi:hypothetical protein
MNFAFKLFDFSDIPSGEFIESEHGRTLNQAVLRGIPDSQIVLDNSNYFRID